MLLGGIHFEVIQGFLCCYEINLIETESDPLNSCPFREENSQNRNQIGCTPSLKIFSSLSGHELRKNVFKNFIDKTGCTRLPLLRGILFMKIFMCSHGIGFTRPSVSTMDECRL